MVPFSFIVRGHVFFFTELRLRCLTLDERNGVILDACKKIMLNYGRTRVGEIATDAQGWVIY